VYVAHDTESYLDLPRATVSSYALDENNGTFLELNREPLCLSAIGPRHIAVSPDGTTLLVAATAGGAYNVLSIAPNGSILRNARSIKLTGRGPHALQASAKPLFACFERSSQLAYACDFGSDRVDQLRFSEGVPQIASHVSLAPGTGPSHLAIHPSQEFLAVSGGLRSTLTMIELGTNPAKIPGITQQLNLEAASLVASSFDATGKTLFVTGRTTTGTSVRITLDVDLSSRSVTQVQRRQFSHVGDPIHENLLRDFALPPNETYSLVATNVPLLYSPVATSPEIVFPSHLLA
jgi:6-phosphogluconolactonase (cycloisomerase 2 family)